MLIELQRSLHQSWCQTFGPSSVETDAPLRGLLEVAGERWAFRRHGAGVEFKRQGDEVAVDIHDRFDDPDVFDIWRLELFLESKAIVVRGRALEQSLMDSGRCLLSGQHYTLT
ncbi:DUF6896 domain-containing protein [Maricaulis virginensis]|uniref:DUF6896 domain-containing protein n=1 Tax=Maricaulis virginensis TaxID=144022 RepID=UPI0022F2A2CF|nr:hypothetical protein [Maricaulis virginensis]